MIDAPRDSITARPVGPGSESAGGGERVDLPVAAAALSAACGVYLAILTLIGVLTGFVDLGDGVLGVLPLLWWMGLTVGGAVLAYRRDAYGVGLVAAAGLIAMVAFAARSMVLFDLVGPPASLLWVFLLGAAISTGRVFRPSETDEPAPWWIVVLVVVALGAGLVSLLAPLGGPWGFGEHLFGGGIGSVVRAATILVPPAVAALAVGLTRRPAGFGLAAGIGIAYALAALLADLGEHGLLAGWIAFGRPTVTAAAFGAVGVLATAGPVVGRSSDRARLPLAIAMALVAGTVTVGASVATAISEDTVEQLAAPTGIMMGADGRPTSGAGEVSADGSDTPPTFGTGLSLASEPTTSWEFLATEIGPDIGVGSLLEVEEGAVDAPHVLVLGDVVVARMGAAAVAIDATTGEELWRREVSTCWALVDATVLLCQDSLGFVSLDPESGVDVARLDRDAHVVSSVDFYGDTIFVVAPPTDFFEGNRRTTVFALDATSLQERWSTPIELEGSGHDTLDRFVVHASRSSISVNRFVRTDDGSGQLRHWILEPTTGEIDTVVDGGMLVENGLMVSRVDDGTVRLGDLDGNTILIAPGNLVWTADGRAMHDGQIIIGGSRYDTTTGEVVWTSPHLEDPAGDQWFVWDTTANAVIGTSASLDRPGVVLDADDGQQRFSMASGLSATVGPVGTDAVFLDPSARTVGGGDEGSAVWTRSWDVVAGESTAPYWHTVITETAVVVAGESGLVGFGGFRTPEQGTPQGLGRSVPSTACGSSPELTPVEVEASGGGVTVRFEFRATCPGGQWLSSTRQLVTVESTRSVEADGVSVPSGTRLLSGVFDFSRTPLWIPDGGVAVPLVFPVGTQFAELAEVRAAIDGDATVVRCEPEEGSSDGPVPATEPTEVPAVTAADSGLDPAAREDLALTTLERIAAADDPSVRSHLADHWVVQLSSKVEGTTDDGIVYTYEDILDEHLRLRLRYDNVRLVNSTDWVTFFQPGYWVTIVGSPSDDWRPPLFFCRDQGFDRSHCYSKFLSTSDQGGPTTYYLDDLGD